MSRYPMHIFCPTYLLLWGAKQLELPVGMVLRLRQQRSECGVWASVTNLSWSP